eukprot:TRINITY_DN35345_c0_g1_i1.p1 TRINITY_DN35345_c0_g1~~TRINITY_DN35345_c0_g1_i1.p1  ORF type:complete len:385 (+),score=68.82 TRINITY_DN35345_c0_g1_i1:79-1233(+)
MFSAKPASVPVSLQPRFPPRCGVVGRARVPQLHWADALPRVASPAQSVSSPSASAGSRSCSSSSLAAAAVGLGLLTGGARGLGRGAARCQPSRMMHRRLVAQAAGFPGMPQPVWDHTGGPAFKPTGAASPKLEKGKLHKVVWMCWTGNNEMPPHLQLCKRTIERNSGLPVIVITPENLLDYVQDPHPAYEHLHLAHRADYLRCWLLHHYGGIYLDADTICLRSLEPLFDELDTFDVVGYDGSQWGEVIGISDMGPFKPMTEFTELWFNILHAKLQERLPEIQQEKTDVFYWQEILRDIVVPVSKMQRPRVSQALLAFNPEQEHLWSVQPWSQVLGRELSEDPHVLILNNAKYGSELKVLTEEQILAGPAVLSQLLRQALGIPEP